MLRRLDGPNTRILPRCRAIDALLGFSLKWNCGARARELEREV
jgi:hypothetical protein